MGQTVIVNKIDIVLMRLLILSYLVEVFLRQDEVMTCKRLPKIYEQANGRPMPCHRGDSRVTLHDVAQPLFCLRRLHCLAIRGNVVVVPALYTAVSSALQAESMNTYRR
jgi:hypothetical protein